MKITHYTSLQQPRGPGRRKHRCNYCSRGQRSLTEGAPMEYILWTGINWSLILFCFSTFCYYTVIFCCDTEACSSAEYCFLNYLAPHHTKYQRGCYRNTSYSTPNLFNDIVHLIKLFQLISLINSGNGGRSLFRTSFVYADNTKIPKLNFLFTACKKKETHLPDVTKKKYFFSHNFVWYRIIIIFKLNFFFRNILICPTN